MTSQTAQSSPGLFGIQWPGFRPWRELTVFALIVMELSWVVPWYRALTPASNAVSVARAFAVLGGMLLAAMLTFRLVNHWRVRIKVRQAIMVSLLFLSVLVGINTLLYVEPGLSIAERLVRPIESISEVQSLVPDEFLVALAVMIAWWRGIGLARLKVGPRDVLDRFQFGFFMLLFYVFVNTLITGETVGNLFYLYLFGGLLAMGAARVSVLSTLRGGQSSPFDRRWLAGMLLATVGLVGLAATAVGLLSGKASFLPQIALGIFGMVVILVTLIVAPLLYVFLSVLQYYLAQAGERAFEGLANLSNALDTMRQNLLVLASMIAEVMEKLGIFRFLQWLPNLRPLTRFAILAVFGLIVVALIGLRLRMLKNRSLGADERSWLLGRGDLFRLLRKAMGDGFKKLGDGLGAIIDLQGRRRRRAAARIRRIYSQMIEMVAELGQPRLEAQTPLEYLPTLESMFPDLITEMEMITRAYLAIRYGELPETEQEVVAVEHAWEHVHRAGEEYGKEAK